MAMIDYSDIHSLRYAKRSLASKALINVLATFADPVTGALLTRHTKIDFLKAHAGISRNATRQALEDLAEQLKHTDKEGKITILMPLILLESTKGHPAEITYLPILKFPQTQKAGDPLSGSLGNLSEDTQLFRKNAVDTRHDSPKPERPISCSDLTTDLTTKTTTGPELDKTLIDQMIVKHESSVVVSIVLAIQDIIKEDPTAIDCPGAYFRACCQNNWIPTMKTIQEKKMITESREKARAAQGAADAVEEKRRQQIREEQSDPEVMKRIQAVQLSFMGMSTPSHSDPDAMSGHVKVRNQKSGQV